jgi:probable HAF family extracellular repeat protein
MPRQFVPLCLLLALSAAPLAAHAGPAYTVALVGGLGGSNSGPNGINNHGQVVGYAYTPSNAIQAYISTNGTATSLQPAGSPNLSGSSAAAVNDAGVVAGQVTYQGGATHAATFDNGQVHDLGTLGGSNSAGYGINASGTVVGEADVASGDQHAFLSQGGTMLDLGALGGSFSLARGLNDLGAVTGYAAIDAAGDYRAFVFAGGIMSGLGTLGGNYSEGYAINNAGQVVGYAYLAGDIAYHAFLYANGVMQDLGSLGGSDSFATDINEAGDVVGTTIDSLGKAGAFLYRGGTLQDLNGLIDPSLGWTLDYAAGINDMGQIAAHGCTAGHQCADLLLTLADTGGNNGGNPLPEPEAFSAGIAGLALMQALRRRRSR